VLLAATPPPAWPAAAGAEAGPPVVVERGPHHRVTQRTLTERRPDTTAERLSCYTEIATGLHYLNERGERLESRDKIEIFDGAAVARQGPHQVIFAANLNSVGAIDLLDPRGQRFRYHVLGLAYTDAATGRSVTIAEAADCTGAVLPPNQVIYQNALAGDGVLADGSLWASNAVGCAWTSTDNLFDTTNLVQSGAIAHNYNAYLTNAARLTPTVANSNPGTASLPTHKDGTPENFTVLSTCPVRWHPDDCGWYERWEQGRVGNAVMGLYTHGGTVFTAGTTDWSHGLRSGDQAVVQITRNLLDRLGR
jgi:hypothetical protein